MSDDAPQHPPGSLKELWRVAVPMAISSGTVSLTYVVDRILLTRYSIDALAASLPAGVMHWTFLGLLIGTVGYVNTFVAQYEGAGKPERVSASVWQGVYFAVLGGAVFSAILAPLSGTIFGTLGHAPSVQRLETDYFSVLCLGAVPMALSATLACFFSGRGRTDVVMYVNFATTLTNGVLDYLLIFGIGPCPEMGIRGAAVATVASQMLGVGLYLALLLTPSRRGRYHFPRHWRFDRELFGRLMKYGLPTGLQYFVEIAGFTVFIILVGRLGTHELAATNLAFNLNTLAFCPMYGFGTAVMALVGQRIGEGRPELAVRTTHLAFKITSLYMLAFAAVYLLLPDLILAPYLSETKVENADALRSLVVQLLRFVALYSFFDGMAIVFGCAIRGAGDTRFSLLFTAVAAWLLMVLPPWLAAKYGVASLSVSWWSCTAYIAVVGLGFWLRFARGPWQSMRVIEHPNEDAIEETPLKTEPIETMAASDEAATDRTPPEAIELHT